MWSNSVQKYFSFEEDEQTKQERLAREEAARAERMKKMRSQAIQRGLSCPRPLNAESIVLLNAFNYDAIGLHQLQEKKKAGKVPLTEEEESRLAELEEARVKNHVESLLLEEMRTALVRDAFDHPIKGQTHMPKSRPKDTKCLLAEKFQDESEKKLGNPDSLSNAKFGSDDITLEELEEFRETLATETQMTKRDFIDDWEDNCEKLRSKFDRQDEENGNIGPKSKKRKLMTTFDEQRVQYPESELMGDSFQEKFCFNGQSGQWQTTKQTSPAELIASRQLHFAMLQDRLKSEASRATKKEKNLSKMWGGHFQLLKQTADKTKIVEREKKSIQQEINVFRGLAQQENRTMAQRKTETQELVATEKLRNKELQREFSELEKVRKELEGRLA